MSDDRVPGVLVLEPGGLLAASICAELAAAGTQVYRHTRDVVPDETGGDTHFSSGPHAASIIAGWDMTHRPITRIVFGPPPPERGWPQQPDEIDGFADRIEARILTFLSELQAAGRLLARHRGGQIWVLTDEPSMRMCLASGECPIESRARQAAVKSFAKEVLHLGIVVNCGSIQTMAEQIPAPQWKAARKRLKVFAMRFEAANASAVARTLTAWLMQPDLPMSGLVIPIGFGFAEQNI